MKYKFISIKPSKNLGMKIKQIKNFQYNQQSNESLLLEEDHVIENRHEWISLKSVAPPY